MNKESIDAVKPIYEHALFGTTPLKDLLKISEEELEYLYSNGYQFNQTGHYVRALKNFRLLVLLDPHNAKYSLALAMVLHQQKHYREAALAYLISSSKDPKNALHWYHLADCYMHLNNPEGSYECLLQAIAYEREETPLKVRAELLAKILEESPAGGTLRTLKEGEAHGSEQ